MKKRSGLISRQATSQSVQFKPPQRTLTPEEIAQLSRAQRRAYEAQQRKKR